MYYNKSVGRRLISLAHIQPALLQLIILNTGVWLALALIQLAGFLTHPANAHGDQLWLNLLLPWIGVPASIPNLLAKPWTIITYMFVHESFWQLFFNMFWLYWFGNILLEFMSRRQLYLIYLIGGISGALAFILTCNIFPVFQETLDILLETGASASVLAIVIATEVLVPEYTLLLVFIGPVRIKYVVIFAVILDLLIFRSGNISGHIGGALSGALFVLITHKDVIRHLGLIQIKSFLINSFRRKPMYKAQTKGKLQKDERFNKSEVIKQQKIDLILDKIYIGGYNSLSEEEKDFLFNSSKNQ